MKEQQTMKATTTKLAVAALVLVGASALTGCRGDRSEKPPRQFLPDMDDTARWNPQWHTDFYSDGRTMRQPVDGTVAFARMPIDPEAIQGQEWAMQTLEDRDELLSESNSTAHGLVDGLDYETAWQLDEDAKQTAFIDTIPIPVDMTLLLRGKERYNIFCAACHGYAGEGGGRTQADGYYGGMVGRRWSYPVPALTDALYTDQVGDAASFRSTDGYLYYTAMYGVDFGGRMPGYDHALSNRDGWAIVAYIRALQASQSVAFNDVTDPDAREQLRMQAGGRMMGAIDGGSDTLARSDETGGLEEGEGAR